MASTPQRTGKPDLGKRLVDLREESNVSRADLAKRAGIAYSFLSGIETGYRAPSAKVLTALAAALDISLDYLTAGTELASPAGEPASNANIHLTATHDAAISADRVVETATEIIATLPASARLDALADVQKRVMEGLLSRS